MTCSNCGKCGMQISRNLSDLQPGDTAKITAIRGEGPLRARILDMGLTKGAVISIIKKAPLGDPLELKVRGYTLSIRKKDASMIEVV